MIIKRKTITRRGGAAGGVDGGGVKSVAVGDSTYQPDEEGQVALPNFVQAVKINSTTHAPNSAGTVDLGNVGGGGTVNSVSANGTTYQPDANGDVDVGDMVKLLSFLGTNYSPDADGKITIANIAGYYASNLNGLNLYGTTQRPLSYDSTTQYLEYSMSPSTSTVSLRLLRTSGMNTQNIAYYIEFRATCHVVSSTSSTARIEGYVEVDAMGVPAGVTWAIGLARVNDASRPIFFALDGLTDAPNYWTTNDAALRQVGFSPTGYQVESYNRDADKFSAKALATSGHSLVNGKRRYYYDLSFDMTGTIYTENAFTDISREASGALSVTVNGATYTPSPDGDVDLGTIAGGGGNGLVYYHNAIAGREESNPSGSSNLVGSYYEIISRTYHATTYDFIFFYIPADYPDKVTSYEIHSKYGRLLFALSEDTRVENGVTYVASSFQIVAANMLDDGYDGGTVGVDSPYDATKMTGVYIGRQYREGGSTPTTQTAGVLIRVPRVDSSFAETVDWRMTFRIRHNNSQTVPFVVARTFTTDNVSTYMGETNFSLLRAVCGLMTLQAGNYKKSARLLAAANESDYSSPVNQFSLTWTQTIY